MTKYNSKFAKMRLRGLGAAVFFLSALIFAHGCKKDPLLGTDGVPSDQLFGILATDTFSFVVSTQFEDSLPSNGLPNALLGSYNDPLFGRTSAAFVTQVKLGQIGQVWNTDSVIVDSVILSLDYASSYGKLDAQTIHVLEVVEALDANATYYSNHRFLTNPVPIATHTFVPKPVTAVVIDTVTLPAHLRINLGVTFGERLINLNQAAYETQEGWLSHIKGFQVVADNGPQSVGDGAILLFDLASPFSRMQLFYHTLDNPDKQEYKWEIDSDCAQANQFDHDFTGTAVEMAVAQGTAAQNMTYVQSMAGIRTKVEFPGLQAFANNVGNIAIQKAELVVTNTGVDTLFPAHGNLALRTINSDGSNGSFVEDLVFEGTSHFGGAASNDSYPMNITRYMHTLIRSLQAGNDENRGLYIVNSGAQTNPNRSVLFGTGNDADNIKLTITYTTLN